MGLVSAPYGFQSISEKTGVVEDPRLEGVKSSWPNFKFRIEVRACGFSISTTTTEIEKIMLGAYIISNLHRKMYKVTCRHARSCAWI